MPAILNMPKQTKILAKKPLRETKQGCQEAIAPGGQKGHSLNETRNRLPKLFLAAEAKGRPTPGVVIQYSVQGP